MKHPEFPIVSFLLVPLLLSSLPSHIRSRSVAIISLVAWMTAMNIIRGVNSIVWAGNVDIKLVVWCDITTKTLIGFTFAVPFSAFCLIRQLEQVSSGRQTHVSKNEKKSRILFESILCFGVPLIFMGLHYIVQGHRFDIIENIGCSPTAYVSIPAVILMWVPPLLVSVVSMVYAVAAFHHFLKRRIEFASVLQNSAISPARYFRLMSLAVFEIFWDTGTNIYILYFNTYTGLRPWISWENVHMDFSRIDRYPDFLVPTEFQIQTIVQWWIIPISSIAFFLFFGFGQEAKSDYLFVVNFVRRYLRPKHAPKPAQRFTILPTHRTILPDEMEPLPSTSALKEKCFTMSSGENSQGFCAESDLPAFSKTASFSSTISCRVSDISDFDELTDTGRPVVGSNGEFTLSESSSPDSDFTGNMPFVETSVKDAPVPSGIPDPKDHEQVPLHRLSGVSFSSSLLPRLK